MTKTLQIQDRVIEYQIRVSDRAKRMRLAVLFGGKVVVTLPRGINETVAEKFIKQKSTWIISKIDFFQKTKKTKKINLNYDDFEGNKDKAFDLALKRVKHFSKIYNFKFGQIKVKRLKTRWGSCSGNNLNFNYKIIFLSTKMRDYVIVHELCHIKEPNHSQKFWNLVAQTIPNYKEITKKLRTEGLVI